MDIKTNLIKKNIITDFILFICCAHSFYSFFFFFRRLSSYVQVLSSRTREDLDGLTLQIYVSPPI